MESRGEIYSSNPNDARTINRTIIQQLAPKLFFAEVFAGNRAEWKTFTSLEELREELFTSFDNSYDLENWTSAYRVVGLMIKAVDPDNRGYLLFPSHDVAIDIYNYVTIYMSPRQCALRNLKWRRMCSANLSFETARH